MALFSINNQSRAMEDKSIIRRKSFDFAVRIVRLFQHISKDQREYVLSKQLLRSGTSVGANVREAHNAESKADFIHKMGITQKECDETLYWLEILNTTDYLSDKEFDSISKDCIEVLKIIKSIILTKKGQTKLS